MSKCPYVGEPHYSRQVQKERAEIFVKENELDGFVETSAKTGDNVTQVFVTAAKSLLTLHNKETGDETPGSVTNNNNSPIKIGNEHGSDNNKKKKDKDNGCKC